MARNNKSKPVDKKDSKKTGEAKGFWNKGRLIKNAEVEKPLVLAAENVDDKNKKVIETVEHTADGNERTEALTERTNEGGTLFENKEDKKLLAASEKGGSEVAPLSHASNKMPELFGDNANLKEAALNEAAYTSKKDDSKAVPYVDENSDVDAFAKSTGGGHMSSDQQINADSVPFDLSKPVYVEIHRGNIFHYYMGGLLLASKYIEKRAFTDIQNVNENFVILTNSGSHGSNSEHILLEIDITGIDKDDFIIHDNFALLAIPLPVTRIRSVLVQNMEIKKSIVNDALLFNGGFIPEGLIAIQEFNLKHKFDFKSAIKNGVKECGHQIDKFDRILGLLAFLRNYDLLISEKSKVYKSLPSHFFYAMQVLDESFGAEIVQKNTISDFYGYLFNDSCPPDKSLLNWLFERLKMGDNFTDTDILAFGKELKAADEDSPAVRNVLSLLSRNLDRKKALQAVDELKAKSALPLYIFAFLRNYGNLNSIDVARRDLSYIYSGLFGEYAFALLGYFYGYRNLRNTDERLASSEMTSIIGRGKAAIKFQLTTRFDYRVIELVYQFVFKVQVVQQEDASTIRYYIKDEKLNGLTQSKNYPVYERLLYGKLYQQISLVNPFEKLLDELSFLPSEIPLLSTFGTFCYQARIRFMPYTVSDWGGTGFSPDKITYLKKDLLSYLSEHKDRIDMEEMQLRVQLEKKMRNK